ncbi:hypothetical protein POM88_016308 [Heracleum sosnowskyi]|uniref:Homeobox domain-containing protein n=1 Tax=Heracleum sosnowskyi TaxID=360622 RepID=A0AAD8ILX5_9APIA|nr:hypothetical protein POM88_016308 [Heracleum sosnowskyi]
MDGGIDGVGGSGDTSHSSGRTKHSHRNTAEQNQRLERMFNECTHPDEDQKTQLSRELGLSTRQIQFWFQNKRTQLKAQQAKVDTFALRAENDRIRLENNAMKEALEHKLCRSCKGPPTCINKHKLLVENALLKEELYRISSEIVNSKGMPTGNRKSSIRRATNQSEGFPIEFGKEQRITISDSYDPSSLQDTSNAKMQVGPRVVVFVLPVASDHDKPFKWHLNYELRMKKMEDEAGNSVGINKTKMDD